MLLSPWLLLLLHCGLSPSVSARIPQVRCAASCAVVAVCTSRVLMCGPLPRHLPVLEPVNCSKLNQLVLLSADSPAAAADYIDPGLFRTLLEDGMKSLLVGLPVSNIRRFSLSQVPDSSGLVVFLNGFFVRQIERFAFEERKIEVSFYSLARPGRHRFQEFGRAGVKKRTFCDSIWSPCLCKNYFPLNGTGLAHHSHFYHEVSTTVCKEYHSRPACKDRSCKLPSQADFASSLQRLARQEIVPHDYCFQGDNAASPGARSSLVAAAALATLLTTLACLVRD